MKKIVNLFLSTIILSCSLFAQNGLKTEKYSNGVLKKEENYFNAKLNGVCKYYSPNGVIKEILNYNLGKKEGTIFGGYNV